ncbi:MAG TPA: LysR family transcriptional regulator [Pyrinomonadaceae bacterium]|nr:LysR family transcriptional regulator [Pyrinomonadaceae bacterium]
MEFQQLEMFTAVVEEGSVSRAAERVFRTAPAVSIAITKLEEEFGSVLFDRSDRQQPELTPSGRVLYSYARRILELRQEATRAIKDGAQRRQGKLRIGTHESTSLYLLPSLLRPFQEAHPEIKTEIVCGTTERLLRALSHGAIDVALVGEATEDAALDRELIFRDRLVFIVNPAHRLCGVNGLTVAALETEVLLVQSTRSKLRQRLAQAFADAAVPLNLGVENIAIEAMKRMVSENLGVGFVPRMCVEEELRQGKLTELSITGVRDDWDLWLVRRKDQNQSAPTQKFLAVAGGLLAPVEFPRPPRKLRAATVLTKPKAIIMAKRKTAHC